MQNHTTDAKEDWAIYTRAKHWSTKNSSADQNFIGRLITGKKIKKHLEPCHVKIYVTGGWPVYKRLEDFEFEGQIQAVVTLTHCQCFVFLFF